MYLDDQYPPVFVIISRKNPRDEGGRDADPLRESVGMTERWHWE